MDKILPYSVLSPDSGRKKVYKLKNTTSKLSLRNKGQFKASKENRPPVCDAKRLIKRDEELLTSDESEPEGSFCVREGRGQHNFSVGSSVLRESTFSLPVAESTRCELPFRASQQSLANEESRAQQFYTANTNSSSSAGEEYVTAAGCDDSVICISDSDSDQSRWLSKPHIPVKQARETTVLISDDSDEDSNLDNDTSNVKSDQTDFRTKVVETSSDSACNQRTKHSFVVPPSPRSDSDSRSSVKSGSFVVPPSIASSSGSNSSCATESKDRGPQVMCSKNISCSSSVVPDNVKESQQFDRRSTRSSTSSVISSSVVDIPCSARVTRRNQKPSGVGSRRPMNVPCDGISNTKKEVPDELTSSQKTRSENSLDESWKRSFRLVMPDTQEMNDSLPKVDVPKSLVSHNQPLPVSKQVPQTITKDKYQDIERWLLRSRSSVSSDSEHLPSSQAPRTNTQDLSDKGEQKRKPSAVNRVMDGSINSSLNGSGDNFEAMMASLRKGRINSNKSTKKAVTESSFINDDSSDKSCSTSPSIYHKDITKSIKAEIKTLARKTREQEARRQLEYVLSSDSEDDGPVKKSSADSRDKPVQRKKNDEIKILRKPSVVISDSEESDHSNQENIWTKLRRPKKNHVFESESDSTSGSTNDNSSSDVPLKRREPKTLPKPVRRKVPVPTKDAKTPQAVPRKVDNLKCPGTPYSPIRTFLSSLAGPAAEANVRSHPEAVVYCKNFKAKKEELTRRLYKLYNREVFDSRLPPDMLLEWNARMVRTAGFCYCKLTKKGGETTRSARIVLSTKVLDTADRLRDTLIHEMCHAAVWMLNNISGGHGPFWKAWATKAMKRFPELPPISRCHDYEIQTKFTYKCTSCGYRHSKSLDLKTQRCGYCYGHFEVVKNNSKPNGNQGAVPNTPRAPSAFALFVKENYGKVKKENDNAKHGEVMKKLSQKFAEFKLKQSAS